MRQYNIILFFTAIFLSGLSGYGQTSASPFAKKFTAHTKTISWKIGETPVLITLMQYGNVNSLVYINLHADESTSVAAAKEILESRGGLLIKIENKDKRNIRFRLHGRYYTFDPNRIFSRDGIIQTLGQLSHVNYFAADEIEKFANRILQLIPDKKTCVIALHNNTPGKFSVYDYLPGNTREKDARMVYADSLQDPDDIFLTTDSLLFAGLSSEKFNTIWQHNGLARRDGSLSIYCGERNIKYINCETEHGKTTQYFEMLQALSKYLYPGMEDAVTYSHNASLSEVRTFSPGKTVDSGERKIGFVQPVHTIDDSLHILRHTNQKPER